MSIPVSCPNCSAKLNAPAAAAGKRVKCPKCQTACSVPPSAFEVVNDAPPAFEVVDDDASLPIARPSTRAAARPRGEPIPGPDAGDATPTRAMRRPRSGDAADEPDAPPKRKRALVGLLVGCLLVFLLMAGGGAFGVYWAVKRYRATHLAPAPETVSLDNWEEYTEPGNVFKARFPGAPERKDWKPNGNVKVTSDIREYRAGGSALGKPSVSFFAGYVRFADNVRPSEIEDAKKWLTTLCAAPLEFGGTPMTTKVTVGGREWDENKMVVYNSVGSTGVVRWHLAGSTLHLIGYRAQNQAPPADAVAQFFDAHVVLGGDPGDPDPDPATPDVWPAYTSPGNFKAAFPGDSKAMSADTLDGAKATEFREYTVKAPGGWTRTYFAGFVRFAAAPTYPQRERVARFVQQQGVPNSSNGRRRVDFGGWPLGEEHRMDVRKSRELYGTSGIVRYVQAGDTIYAAGIKSPRMPRDKEVEQFFGAFEILAAKPGPLDRLLAPDWAEHRPADGAFRAAMPKNVHRVPPLPYDAAPAGVKIKSLEWYRADELDTTFLVGVVRFLPDTAEADRQKVVDALARFQAVYVGKPTVYTDKNVSWAGRDAIDRTYPDSASTARITCGNDAAYIAVIKRTTHPSDMKPTVYDAISPSVVQAFLDSFSFDKNAPPLVPPKPVEWTAYKSGEGFGPSFAAQVPPVKSTSRRSLRLTASQKQTFQSVWIHRITDGPAALTVLAIEFVPGTTAAARQTALNSLADSVMGPAQGAKLSAQNKITWGGRDALEHVYTPDDLCACRQTHNETTGYIAGAYALDGKLDAAKAKRFLDSITFPK
ncbi:zinc-ribbon domain-containing protein [Gemmata sp. JC673]|uniref:Zinc-ribbon domain-containing protein n=1 Tax=Gemmata algarum TaxID=2975278 RepID=A0ABU5F9W0_9BACT|nr:hypothetical protein [Gemmata algarum]MDY3563562.1 zinc-ribbon domain-containing protein [Gemmata algarum]